MENFITEKLNEVQKRAVLSDSRYILVTAGAGSGKTRVLTERIINLVNCRFVHPENILAITFTNKASNVMKERLSEKGLSVSRLWISTFHSICVRILRENAHLLEGYNNNFTIFDETDKNKVISDILKEQKIEEDGFKKKLAYHISNFKSKNQNLEKYEEDNCFERNIEDIIEFIKIYEEKMKQNNAFDFDDLLQKTLHLLINNPEALNYYQNKFKHILVDEFQDTNEIQYDLIKLLSSGENSIFVVGDEDQCIYSWRGANYENISNFTKDFLNVEIIKLEQNYRSSKKIIEAANNIISKNTQRIEKNLWTDNDEGLKIEYKKCYDESEEAEFVASTIYGLNSYNNIKFKDMAVLVRLNSLTRNIEEKLLNYGINYRVYGGMKFYERLEIKSFLAYLKVVCNTKDDVSFSKIANWPKRGIGEASLDKLKQINPLNSMLENLISLNENSGLSGATYKKLLELKYLFENLLVKKEELDLVDFTHYVVDILRLKEKLNIEEEDKNRILNIEQLLLSIEEFAKNNENANLNDYLQSVTLVSDIDSYNEEEDCVTIATVHASKGLEFKCVFVIGLEEGIFPLIRQDCECDIEEERRLMYVAVTRSMERLYLTRTMSRFMYGFRKAQICSSYVKDLGFEQPKIRQEYGYSSSFENSSSYGYSSYNNLYKEDYVKSATEVKLNSVSDKSFNVGDRINHTKFGEGVIVSINGDVGKIAFKGVGIKELMLNLAPITKI